MSEWVSEWMNEWIKWIKSISTYLFIHSLIGCNLKVDCDVKVDK